MNKPPRIPSQRVLAKALGISPARVSALKRQGMPTDSLATAQAWRGRLRVYTKPGLKSEPSDGLKSEPVDDARAALDMGDAFVNAALFAEIHGIEVHVPVLQHLLWLMDDAQYERIRREGETPQAVWDAIAAAAESEGT